MQFSFVLALLVLAATGTVSDGSRYDIVRSTIEDAWQSSIYPDSCFTETADHVNSFNYFHSGGTPDSSGYQWLLLKLTRSVRVLSVTVHARPEEPVRVHGIEVLLLSGDLPPSLRLASPGHCQATLIDWSDLSGLTGCGRTSGSENAGSLAHRVDCEYSGCAPPTRFLLLRRFVLHETDKYMNFVRLELLEADGGAALLRCSPTGGRLAGCSDIGAGRVQTGSLVTAVACLPCKLAAGGAEPTCFISPVENPEEKVGVRIFRKKMSSFLMEFTVRYLSTRRLECRYDCDDGLARSNNRTIELFQKPRSVRLELTGEHLVGQRACWVVGRTAGFTFITESAFPLPAHECRLLDRLGHQRSLAVVDEAQSNLDGTSRLVSRCSLSVGSDLERFVLIRCTSDSTASKILLEQPVPQLIPRCRTQFRLSPAGIWKEGTLATLTVDSSDGNRVATSHACLLESGRGNVSLHATNVAETMSSTYTVNVSRQWGRSASIVCLANQSGLIETWTRHQLPPVFYSPSPITWSGGLNNGTDLRLTALLGDGNPRPELRCSLAAETVTIEQLTTESNPDDSSNWTQRIRLNMQFPKPVRQVKLACDIVQMAANATTAIYGPTRIVKTFAATNMRQYLPSPIPSNPVGDFKAAAIASCLWSLLYFLAIFTASSLVAAGGFCLVASRLRVPRARLGHERVPDDDKNNVYDLVVSTSPVRKHDPNTIYYDDEAL